MRSCCCCCCCCCSHIDSHNQVRGHRTGSSHSGAEEYPREKHTQPKVVRSREGLPHGVPISPSRCDSDTSFDLLGCFMLPCCGTGTATSTARTCNNLQLLFFQVYVRRACGTYDTSKTTRDTRTYLPRGGISALCRPCSCACVHLGLILPLIQCDLTMSLFISTPLLRMQATINTVFVVVPNRIPPPVGSYALRIGYFIKNVLTTSYLYMTQSLL